MSTVTGYDITVKISTKKAALRDQFIDQYCKPHSRSFLSNLYFAKFGIKSVCISYSSVLNPRGWE